MVAYLHFSLGHGDKKINRYGGVGIKVDEDVKRFIGQTFNIFYRLMMPIQVALTKEVRLELPHVPDGRQFLFYINVGKAHHSLHSKFAFEVIGDVLDQFVFRLRFPIVDQN